MPTPCRAPSAFRADIGFAEGLRPVADPPVPVGSSGKLHCGPDAAVSLSAGAAVDLTCLSTLLWDCVRDPNCPAFFLASTLLETCYEYFGHPPLSRPSRRRLDLAAHVPPLSDCSIPPLCPFWSQLGSRLAHSPWCRADTPGLQAKQDHEPLAIGPYQAPCTVGQLLQLLLPEARLGDGWDVICTLRQQDVSALNCLSFVPADFTAECLHCFTDGSFCATSPAPEDSCAWACLFVCPRTGCSAAISGKVPAWAFRRDRPSAFVAECYALLVAAWLSVTFFFRMPVAMLSDCVSAIGIYQGHFAGANDGVAVALRSFGIFGRELSPHPPRAAHVPGHRGHLGNEIADRLARSAAMGRCCGYLQWSADQQQPWWLSTGSPLGWAGVALSCLSATGVYPPPSTGGLPPCTQLSGLDPTQLVAPFLPPTALSDRGPTRGNWGHFSLRVCSFNVLSLNSLALEGTAADGLAYQPARPTLLADSLRAAGVCFRKRAPKRASFEHRSTCVSHRELLRVRSALRFGLMRITPF